jgi:hypothetical protein
MLETSDLHKSLYAELSWTKNSTVLPDPRLEHLKYCINNVKFDGQYLEFGVFRAYTINYIAALVPEKIIYGFDSFLGLPEDWLWLPRGEFSTAGQLPSVLDNVKLIQGWFQDTLPKFNKSPIAFLHMDCDLYSSAKYVLDTLENYIVPGTIIAFDDFPYFPGSEQHEYRAFWEFVKRTGKSYQVLARVESTPYTSVIFT